MTIRIIFLLIISTLTSSAQNAGSYQADLEQLYSILQKTPSFQDQVKGDSMKNYARLYESLRNDTLGLVSDYDVFYKLTQLFFPFKDNHLGFYQFPAEILDRSKFTDSAAIKAYRMSKAFREYPKVSINIDSLELVLKQKPKDSVEGIYYYDKYLKIGLFRTRNPAEYNGVVLATTLPTWEIGQLAVRLFECRPHYFRAIYGHPVHKGLMLHNNEQFRNSSLINSYFYSSCSESVYKKEPEAVDFVNIKKSEPEFQYKVLAPHIQYIRLGNFSAHISSMQIAQAFYDSIKNSLTAPHLIVDLRNNTGGADKVSRKFYQLIKNCSEKGKVYVVINNETMSQGEIFTLQLKKLPNVKLIGQTTKGTLAYGSNYGKTVRLPSGRFQVYVTDMRSGQDYFRYESFGVPPDIFLQNDKGWLDAIVQEIENQNNNSSAF